MFLVASRIFFLGLRQGFDADLRCLEKLSQMSKGCVFFLIEGIAVLITG